MEIKQWKEKAVDFFKSFPSFFKENLRTIVIVVVVALVILFGFYIVKKVFFKSAPKAMYSVAVVTRDKSDLKYGDVLLYKEGIDRPWSKSEKYSYLILHMELTKEQAQKLTEGVSRDLSKKEKDEELANFKKGAGEDLDKKELERFSEELEQRTVTVASRKYRVEMEKYFKGFNPEKLIKGQPFQEKVYGWKIMEKRDIK